MAKKSKRRTGKPDSKADLSNVLTVRVSDPLKQSCERIARAQTTPHMKVGLADVAREALIEFVERKEKEFAAA